MIKTAPDGLILFAFLMVLPGKCLFLASFRDIRFRIRMIAIGTFQLGSIAGLIWLTVKYGWRPVWHALGTVQHTGPFFGWVVTALFLIALASPIITALIVRNALNLREWDRIADVRMCDVLTPGEFEAYRPQS